MNTYELPTTSEDLQVLQERVAEALRTARATEARERYEAQQRAAKEALATAPRARFFTATKELRREGVKWHTNVMQCCRGCVTPEQIGLKDEDDETPYAWTFGGQGSALKWDRETGFAVREMRGYGRTWGGRVNHDEPVTVYVNHGNGSAAKVVEAFRRNGFTVEWDGSDSQCVQIEVPVR